MRKAIKKKYRNLFIVSYFTLILFWFFASLVFVNKISFTVITDYAQNLNSYKQPFMIVNNKPFKGSFIAGDNNLGLIILSTNYKSSSEKNRKIYFKVKEKGRSDWLLTRSYDIDIFDSQKSFTFGLPIVINSKNKEYQLELSIDKGRNKLEIVEPNNLLIGYKYSKTELRDPRVLIHFFLSKIKSSFTDIHFILNSLIYLVPLFIFIIFVLSFKKIYPLKKFLKYILPFLILIELLFPNVLRINVFYIFIFLWIVAVFTFKLKSNSSFILGFVLLLIWIVILPFNIIGLQNTLNVVVYSLLLFGAVQLLTEEKAKNEK